MKINYDVLQPCDIVFTTSLSLIADGIRTREANWTKMFDTKLSTHVGIILPMGTTDVSVYAIAEMLGDGLKINSLSDYVNKGFWGERIVDIKRFEPFTNKTNNLMVIKQIMQWWKEGKKYDYVGIIKYVLPFLKDRKSEFYCSELIDWLAINIAKKNIVEGASNDDVHPYALQTSKLLTSVEGWKI
jgi:hypothetical protein